MTCSALLIDVSGSKDEARQSLPKQMMCGDNDISLPETRNSFILKGNNAITYIEAGSEILRLQMISDLYEDCVHLQS